jgi:hypothetical protein
MGGGRGNIITIGQQEGKAVITDTQDNDLPN